MKGDKDEDPLPIVKYSGGSIRCGTERTGAQICVITAQHHYIGQLLNSSSGFFSTVFCINDPRY